MALNCKTHVHFGYVWLSIIAVLVLWAQTRRDSTTQRHENTPGESVFSVVFFFLALGRKCHRRGRAERLLD